MHRCTGANGRPHGFSFVVLVQLSEIQATLSCKRDGGSPAGAFDVSGIYCRPVLRVQKAKHLAVLH